jgi:hypothetical protein
VWEDLAFILFFLSEVGLHMALSQQVPAFALVVPIFGTVVYSLWRGSYAPAFIAGLLSG